MIYTTNINDNKIIINSNLGKEKLKNVVFIYGTRQPSEEP